VEKMTEVPRVSRWAWVFACLITALSVGAVVIVMTALETPESFPKEIDVVMLEASSGPTARQARVPWHIKAVQKHMKWVRNIHVLCSSPPANSTVDEQVKYTAFSGSASDAFQFMSAIPGIADHAIFLDDRTVPMRDVRLTYLYSGQSPRVFNVFRDYAEEDFFQPAIELPTLPCMVVTLSRLKEVGSWSEYVRQELIEESLVMYPGMNRDVMIRGDNPRTAAHQLKRLASSRPLFVTWHVSAVSQSEDSQTTAHQMILDHFL
jgi:hypothetical protein